MACPSSGRSNFETYAVIQKRLEACEEKIQAICKAAGVLGMSLGVVQGDHVNFKFNHGFKDLVSGEAPTSATVYGIGAITMSFTAMAIAQLVDQGRLRYGMLVKDILPGFRSSSRSVTDGATVADVLTHRLCLARSDAWWCGANGEALLTKRELLDAIAEMPPAYPFRSRVFFSNWNYALAGEIIEAVVCVPYGFHILKTAILPLCMSSTTADRDRLPSRTLASPHATLDNGNWALLRGPQVQGGTIMGSALGILSSVDDLLVHASTVIRALNGEPFFNDGFTNLNIGTSSSMLGFSCRRLPGPIKDSINQILVRNLPKVTPRPGGATCVVSQTGSLAGYTSLLAMLPEIGASVVVLTNSTGLADPTFWVAHLLIEALVDSPNPVDTVSLAVDASRNYIQTYQLLAARFEREHESGMIADLDLRQYVGAYRYIGALNFSIVVQLMQGNDMHPQLKILFQGQQSQSWNLAHLQGDTFHWLRSRDWHAQRGRLAFPLLDDMFKIVFIRNEDNMVDGLTWGHDRKASLAYRPFTKVPGCELPCNLILNAPC